MLSSYLLICNLLKTYLYNIIEKKASRLILLSTSPLLRRISTLVVRISYFKLEAKDLEGGFRKYSLMDSPRNGVFSG